MTRDGATHFSSFIEGKAFGYTPGQAAAYAMNRIGFLEKEGRQLDPQIFLDLEADIERTSRTADSVQLPRGFGIEEGGQDTRIRDEMPF